MCKARIFNYREIFFITSGARWRIVLYEPDSGVGYVCFRGNGQSRHRHALAIFAFVIHSTDDAKDLSVIHFDC